jgi:hypothetical protein
MLTVPLLKGEGQKMNTKSRYNSQGSESAGSHHDPRERLALRDTHPPKAATPAKGYPTVK